MSPNLYPVGTTGHEIGHQLDFIWGGPSEHQTWIGLVNDDLASGTGYMDSPDGGVTPRPCTEVFSQQRCDEVLAVFPGYKNTDIFFLYLHFSVDPVELFPMMFEHLQTNSHNPELEHALQFCPSMNGYMDQAINFGIRP